MRNPGHAALGAWLRGGTLERSLCALLPSPRGRCSRRASSAGRSSRPAWARAALIIRTAGARAQRGSGARRGSASSPGTATAARFTFGLVNAARGRSCSRFTTWTAAVTYSWFLMRSSPPSVASTTPAAARDAFPHPKRPPGSEEGRCSTHNPRWLLRPGAHRLHDE
jgi:hypothetical protein